MRDVSNTQDYLDSREIEARIQELEETLADMTDDTSAFGPNDPDVQEVRDELDALRTFAEEASDYATDWAYGATLIRDSYFEEYARETAEDLGLIGKDTEWPATHIDWDAAADELRQDYTSVDYDGVTYWVR